MIFSSEVGSEVNQKGGVDGGQPEPSRGTYLILVMGGSFQATEVQDGLTLASGRENCGLRHRAHPHTSIRLSASVRVLETRIFEDHCA